MGTVVGIASDVHQRTGAAGGAGDASARVPAAARGTAPRPKFEPVVAAHSASQL